MEALKHNTQGVKLRVAFHTLGCKLNFSESSSIRRLFENEGYQSVPFTNQADIYIINTCSVTDFADKKCRKVVKQSKRRNPLARVIVMGCYAQLKPQEIAAIDGVDLVLGAAEKFRIIDIVRHQSSLDYGHEVVRVGNIASVDEFESAYSLGDRTRSFLKVQDGCDYRCSFCTIPLARGKSRSATIAQIVRSAEELAHQGVKEIVLTGVNIGDFGHGPTVKNDLKKKKPSQFIDLIKALDQVDGIARFRISSIEPNLLTDDIIDFVGTSDRFMPHFHIPLQSGNNKQLRLMKRRYKRELYKERVHRIKSVMPQACIGLDVMVGFPGETDDDFLESYAFIEGLDVSYLHVFTYSERANTLAAMLPDPIDMNRRRKRNEMMSILSVKKMRSFEQQFIGTEQCILLESSKQRGYLQGHTENYIKIKMAQKDYQANSIIKVVLKQTMLASN